jgi:hypothetical protein
MSQQASLSRIPWNVLVGDQEPDAWLEMARRALLFHSHSAMHQAIAQASGLSYHTVHKCLSGSRKPRRIPRAISTCLTGWLDCLAAGGAPDIPDEFRAVPADRMQGLLPALLARCSTKSAIYEALAQRTGVQPTTMRRYFCDNGQACYAPLPVYRAAQELAAPACPPARDSSYLADEQTRRLAYRLADRLRAVLSRWKCNGPDPDLELEYRRLRRTLISTIKEQRVAAQEGAQE